MANKTSSFGYLNCGKIELDNFQCLLAGLLNQINLGLICVGLLLIIYLIALFDGIKENLRWVVLNQAIFDLIISCRFISFNWIDFFHVERAESTCIHDMTAGMFSSMFECSIETNFFSPLLLLSFARFLVFYYPTVHQKLTQGRRLLYLIVIFIFVIIITAFGLIIDRLQRERTDMLKQQCLMSTPINITSCPIKYEGGLQFQLYKALWPIQYFITFTTPSICLLISGVLAILTVIKIKQLNKIQNNPEPKNCNIRICAVTSLQIFIVIFAHLIDFSFKLPLVIGTTLKKTNIFEIFIIPSWFDRKYGVTDYGVLQAIMQIRILVESLIVLFFMTEFREYILRAFNWCLRKRAATTTTTTAN